LSSQLQYVEQAIGGYFDAGRMKELLSGTTLGTLLARALSWGTTAVAIAASLLLVIIGGIYMAIDPEVYRNGLIKLFPLGWQDRVRATLDDAGEALRLWLAAQLTAMVLVGLMIATGAFLIGIPSPLALGLIFGLMEFVPVVGPIAGAVPVLLVALGQGWEMALWALGLVLVVQQVESNLIMPLVSGRAVQLPPAVGLFAVVAMGIVFGPLGLVLGYPLAVVCDVTRVEDVGNVVRQAIDRSLQVIRGHVREASLHGDQAQLNGQVATSFDVLGPLQSLHRFARL